MAPNIADFAEDDGLERSYSPAPQVEDGADANKLFVGVQCIKVKKKHLAGWVEG